MTTTWKLTGKPSGSGQCEHCPRSLVHRYEVTSTETGAKMIVGRGCLKAVTGWTLTAAQAEREIRMIATRARRAANWAAFAETSPTEAATILADCETYAARYNMATLGGGASHEVKLYVEDGERDLGRLVSNYMDRRHTLAWVTR